MRLVPLAPALLLAITSAPACAQPVIRLGETVEAEVTESDPRQGMGEYPYDEGGHGNDGRAR